MNGKLSHIFCTAAAAAVLPLTSCMNLSDLGLTSSDILTALQTLAGETTASGESYDSSGNAIYGYDGTQAVYGYTAAGTPIYSPSQLTAGCIVPNWAPRPGARPLPPGVHRGGPPPRAHHKNAGPLRKPGDKAPGARGGHDRRHDMKRGDARRGDRMGGRMDRKADNRRPGMGDRPGNKPGMGGKPGNKPGASKPAPSGRDKKPGAPGRPGKP